MIGKQKREWVIGFWIEQMRKQNAPDLPEFISIEDFEIYSKSLSDILESKYNIIFKDRNV